MMTSYLGLHKDIYQFRRLIVPTQWTHFGDLKNAPAGCEQYFGSSTGQKKVWVIGLKTANRKEAEMDVADNISVTNRLIERAEGLQIDIGDLLETPAWATGALLKARTEGRDMSPMALLQSFMQVPQTRAVGHPWRSGQYGKRHAIHDPHVPRSLSGVHGGAPAKIVKGERTQQRVDFYQGRFDRFINPYLGDLSLSQVDNTACDTMLKQRGATATLARQRRADHHPGP
jgi:hypothetical protein